MADQYPWTDNPTQSGVALCNTDVLNDCLMHLKYDKSGNGGGLELCDIGTALYVDETKGLRRRLNGSIMDITGNYQAFLTRLKEITTLYPSLVCTEAEWQTIKTMSKLGQCGKFVYNYDTDGTTVTSIRLPLVININGLVDMSNAGLIKDESLPNITEEQIRIPQGTGASGKPPTGAFVSNATGKSTPAGTADIPLLTSFNASGSSSTYQDNAPVQQEAIQYPYYIQIATGQKTENNIVNDIELNNPFTFGMNMYFKGEMGNISWLKSNGGFHPKATYSSFYNWLLQKYNSNTKQLYGWIKNGGTSVCYTDTPTPVVGDKVYGDTPINVAWGTITAVTDTSITYNNIAGGNNITKIRHTAIDGVYHTYDTNKVNVISSDTLANGEFLSGNFTDYDFVINTTNETFRLPLKNGQEGALIKQAPVVGNGYPVGFYQYGNNTHSDDAPLGLYPGSGQGVTLKNFPTGTDWSTPLNQVTGTSSEFPEINSLAGLSLNPAHSGMVTDLSQATVPSGWNLYYYVGETVQNANLINAGRIAEELTTKTNMLQASGAGMPSSKYVDLTLGESGSTYTAPANGWFCVGKRSNASGQYLSIFNNNANVQSSILSSGSNQALVVFLPVKKGEIISITYSTGGNTERFKFVYAEGAE